LRAGHAIWTLQLAMAPRSRSLTPAERRAWRDDGFFVRRAVFSESELAALREAAERVVSDADRAARASLETYAIDGNRYAEGGGSTIQWEHAEGSETLRVVEPFHHLDDAFDRLVEDPRIVDPMCDLLGADRAALFTDKLNLKRPGEGSRFRWHQDSPYWGHFCDHLDQLPNVMLALDDASEENGCFRVVRASHREGALPGREGDGVLGPLFTDERYFDVSQQVPAVVPAGSLIFFSPHTVHGSEPNRSDRQRRALVLTYQPADKRMFKVPRTRNVTGTPRAAARAI
jgi:ectoine hydroxylase-related dioxygenase (phytanoyl-CoA dioxygenase family)